MKKINTQLGIIEISKTNDRVSYKYGKRWYSRTAWTDNNGGIWVKFCNQFNLLRKVNRGYYERYEMWITDPCGN